MTVKQRRAFYESREWRNMSRQIRARDGWLCTACKPRTVGAELVHHIKPLSEGGARMDPANLTSLCSKCHSQIHAAVEDEDTSAWKVYIRELMNEAI